MALFDTVRAVSFAAVLTFAAIVLGISGHWMSLLQGYYPTYPTYFTFALAVSVISWAFLLPVYLVGILRKGFFLSWVIAEAGVCGLLWVLWLASASYTTHIIRGMTGGSALNCDHPFLGREFQSTCRQLQAIQAFSWLTPICKRVRQAPKKFVVRLGALNTKTHFAQ